MDSPISSSYRRYKQDSNIFTTWLGKAASRCGWKDDNLQKQSASASASQSPQAKAPKLKGRARKLAREAGGSENGSTAHASTPTKNASPSTKKYAVDSKTLLEQARVVAASNKPKIAIPETILWVVNRAIFARKRFSRWYTKTGQDSDDGHAHFIRVLEDAMAILKPNDGSPNNPSQMSNDTPDVPTELANKFSALDIHDLDLEDDFMYAEPSTTAKAKAAAVKPKEVYELEFPDELDYAFDIYCLFEDLHELQERVRQAWSRYTKGQLDLLAATLVTQAAIQFAQRAEDDLLSFIASRWSKAKSYEGLTGVIFWADYLAMSIKDLADNDVGLPEHLRENPLLQRDLDDFLYVKTFRTLRRYTQVRAVFINKDIEMPYPPPLMPIKLEFISAPELLNPEWEKEDLVLSQYLMDLGFLQRSKEIYRTTNPQHGKGSIAEAFSSWRVPEDGISRLLLRTVDECELSVATVFAARLFLDLQDTFNYRPSRALEDLNGRVSRRRAAMGFKAHPNGELDTGSERWKTEHVDGPISAWVLTERASPGKLIFPMLKRKYMETGLVKDEEGFKGLDELDPETREAATEYLKQKNPDMLLEPPEEFREAIEEFKRGGRKVEIHEDDHFLFNHNPSFCGTIALDLALTLEGAGINLMNWHMTIFALAHLYNAAKQFGGLKESWPMLEKVTQIHIVQFFGGELPKKPVECANRMKLKLGYSMQNFASNPRQLGNAARNLGLARTKQLRLPNAEVTDASTSMTQINEPTSTAAGSALAQIETLAMQRRRGKHSSRSSGATALAPGPALDLLESYVQDKLEDITIDYITLTRTCSHLLRRIRRRIRRQLGLEYPDNKGGEDSNDAGLLVVAMLTLEECAFMEEVGKQLEVVIEVLKEHIERVNGDMQDVPANQVIRPPAQNGTTVPADFDTTFTRNFQNGFR